MKGRASLLYLQRDLEALQRSSDDLSWLKELRTKDLLWHARIEGAQGTMWTGLQYDVDIAFSRRHPFEPPKVSFPDTALNRVNPHHPLVDIDGVLRSEFLSFQAWLPTCGALEVLQHVRELFTSHPLMEGADAQPALLNLPTEALHRILRFLSVEDILHFGQMSKSALRLSLDDDLWANLYYSRCLVPAGYLYLSNDMGPKRVLAVGKLFVWQDAREQFIRVEQMHEHLDFDRTIEVSRARELKALGAILQQTPHDDLPEPDIGPLASRQSREAQRHGFFTRRGPNMVRGVGSGHWEQAKAVLQRRFARTSRIVRWCFGDSVVHKHLSAPTCILPRVLDWFASQLEAQSIFTRFRFLGLANAAMLELRAQDRQRSSAEESGRVRHAFAERVLPAPSLKRGGGGSTLVGAAAAAGKFRRVAEGERSLSSSSDDHPAVGMREALFPGLEGTVAAIAAEYLGCAEASPGDDQSHGGLPNANPSASTTRAHAATPSPRASQKPSEQHFGPTLCDLLEMYHEMHALITVDYCCTTTQHQLVDALDFEQAWMPATMSAKPWVAVRFSDVVVHYLVGAPPPHAERGLQRPPRLPPHGEDDQPNGLLGRGDNGERLPDAQPAAPQQRVPLGRCRADPFTGQPLETSTAADSTSATNGNVARNRHPSDDAPHVPGLPRDELYVELLAASLRDGEAGPDGSQQPDSGRQLGLRTDNKRARRGPRQLDLLMSMHEYGDHMMKGPQYLSVISRPVVTSVPLASAEEADRTSHGAFLHYDCLSLENALMSKFVQIEVHYVGHASRFDETFGPSSGRIAPYRAHSERPITTALEDARALFQRVQNGVSQSVKEQYHQVSVRCLWLMSRPGGGAVRYMVPWSTTLRTLVDDFVQLMGFPADAEFSVAKIDLHTAINAVLQDVYSPSGSVSSSRSDVTWPGVTSLASSLTLDQVGCRPGDVIDILYSPRPGESLVHWANR